MAADAEDSGGPDLRGLGIMQLLKQASRRRGSSSSTSSTSSAANAIALPGASAPGGSLEMAIARLARGGMPQPSSQPAQRLCIICGDCMCFAGGGVCHILTQLAQGHDWVMHA